MPARLVFWGQQSIWSAGDDAPLTTLIDDERLSPISPSKPHIVVARHPSKNFDKNFGVMTIPNLEYPTKAESLGKWLRGLNPGENTKDLNRVMEHIEDADFLVLGPGNFVTENSLELLRGPLAHACTMAFLASLTNTPVMLYGLSAARLASPHARRLAQWLLQESEIVTFRDKLSVENLLESGVALPDYYVLPDPVLGARKADQRAAEELSREWAPKKGPRLALAPRWTRWNEGLNTFETILAVTNLWLAHNPDADVLVVAQCTYDDLSDDDDRDFGHALRDACNDASRVVVDDRRLLPWQVEGLYSLADVALTVRLHGAVFASRMGIPTVGLSYDPKVSGFFSSMGRQAFCFEMPASPFEVFERLRYLVDNRQTESQHVQEVVAQLSEDTRAYADLLCKRIGLRSDKPEIAWR